ncbi:MAG: hypothetical protein K2O58_11520 [Bacteroidales bacterium]|nr:hypothetical protein [Bacteroidales bacterium]
MNYRILNILIVALLFAGGVFSACNDRIEAEDNPQYSPSITLSSSIVTVASIGGGQSVGYTLSGAPEGGKAKVTSDEDWVEVSSVTSSSAVLLIQENTGNEDRTATVTFSYDGAKNVYLVVMQNAAAREEESHFEITVSNITTVGADVLVVPDSQISWLYGIVTKDEYDALGAKGYIDARLKQINDMIQIYPGVTFDNFLAVGEMKAVSYTLNDDTDYYATAFDLTKDGKSSGTVALKEFRTRAAVQSSCKITVTMDGSVIRCIPSVNSDTYMCDVVAKEIWDEYRTPKAIAQDYVLVMKSQGYLAASLHSGSYMEDHGNFLVRGKEYVAYAFGYRYVEGANGSSADGTGITTDIFSYAFVY